LLKVSISSSTASDLVKAARIIRQQRVTQPMAPGKKRKEHEG